MIEEAERRTWRTTAVPNPDWWDEATHNLTRVEFQPIANDSNPTSAALLSGEMDMAYPIPLQDIQRVEQNEGTRTLTGPELRTIFLGMDQARDELLYRRRRGARTPSRTATCARRSTAPSISRRSSAS